MLTRQIALVDDLDIDALTGLRIPRLARSSLASRPIWVGHFPLGVVGWHVAAFDGVGENLRGDRRTVLGKSGLDLAVV